MAKPWTILKETFWEFYQDDSFTLAAALSYYIIFALPSLFIVVIAIVSIVVDPTVVRDQIFLYAQEFLHPDVAQQLELIFQRARQRSFAWNFATILGIGVLIFAATVAFVRLQTALNHIWQVRPDPQGNMIVGFLLKRAFSFALVVGVAVLLLFSLLFSVVINTFTTFFVDLAPAGFTAEVAFGLDIMVSFVILSLIFAAVFKVVPDVQVSWRDVGIGALATAVLFMIGKYLIGLYLAQSNVATAYGAAGSLAVVLVWFYYSSLLLFLGAEFTQVYARHSGREIKPETDAVRVTEEPSESEKSSVEGDREGAESDGDRDSFRSSS